MSHLVLIDSNSLIHRAYHAFPKGLQNSQGEITGATFGFTKSLLNAIRDLKPTHLAATFDLAAPTFRHLKYKQYKANRAKMPADLFNQLDRIKEVLIALNIPIFQLEGFEADDLVGTLAFQAKDFGVKSTIVTGDLDGLQLVVDDLIFVWTPARNGGGAKTYNEQAVIDRYGFGPEYVVDYKALKGDPSDNIPGVTGIGEKTAQQLIAQWGHLKDILDQAAEAQSKLPAKILEKLQKDRQQADLSLELATIDTQAPIKLDLEACKIHDYDNQKVKKLFELLEFNSLLKDLPQSSRTANTLFSEEKRESAKSLDLDRQLAAVLRKVEARGVKIDNRQLKTLEGQLEQEIEKIKKEIFMFAGEEFNLDSPSQLAQVLYEKLNLPTQFLKKGKAGHFPTDAATLKKLQNQTPLASLLIQYRELNKLLTTYIRPLPKLMDQDNRLHTHYAPDTASGRISSREPNLQNIPIKSEIGRQIRRAFIADQGCLLLSADYSQIELRVVAHLSGDTNMISAFQKNWDIHDATAKRMGVDRRIAKIINFSILYGKRAYTLAEDLGIEPKLASEFIDSYFKAFPLVKKYLDSIIEQVRKVGYAETLLGKRRVFPEILANNFYLRAAAEREAVNHPIQGTAAEILKLAMVEIDQQNLDANLILTVHDELVFEIKEDCLAKNAKIIKEVMENVYQLKVPLVSELKVGQNWGEMKVI